MTPDPRHDTVTAALRYHLDLAYENGPDVFLDRAVPEVLRALDAMHTTEKDD